MRYAFIHARIYHECFSDPIISYAKKSYKESSRISSEKRLLGKHGGKLRLPANFDFLLKIEEWKDHNLNAKGKKMTVAEILKRRCSYLACKFCYNFGTRFCNVGWDKKTKGIHCIKRMDIIFEDISGRRFHIDDYVEFLKSINIWDDFDKIYSRVICLVIFIHSSKVRKVIGRVEVLGTRSCEESKFLRELILWILKNSGLGNSKDPFASEELKYNGSDPLFSRRHTKFKTHYFSKLHRREVNTATKFAASALNLNKSHFSTHSWKKGSISNMLVNGERDNVLRKLGDHAVNSSSTFLYQHDLGVDKRPLLFASKGSGFTIKEISKISPIEKISYDKLDSDFIIHPFVEIEAPHILFEDNVLENNYVSDNNYFSDSDSDSDSESDSESISD